MSGSKGYVFVYVTVRCLSGVNRRTKKEKKKKKNEKEKICSPVAVLIER